MKGPIIWIVVLNYQKISSKS